MGRKQQDEAKNKKWKAQLGLCPTSATNRLKKNIIFEYAKRLGLGNCYRCGEELSVKDFTIDHKKNWLDIDLNLFWDVDNIAFSHFYCNSVNSSSKQALRKRTSKECKECKEFLPLNSFGKTTINGFRSYCNPCRINRRREGKSY